MLFYRVEYFKILRDETQLTSSSTSMDEIARQRALEELTEDKEAEAENTLTKYFYTHQTN